MDWRGSHGVQRIHRDSTEVLCIFLRRWRKRRGVQEGKIPIGEKVSLKELQAKVLICSLAAATTDPSSGRVRGPHDF